MTTHRLSPDMDHPVFTIGSHPALLTVASEDVVHVETQDCFSGRLTSVDMHPRDVAPYPKVNPLTGPISIEGVVPGDVVGIHLADVQVDRDWGVATVSPRFGALASSASSPTLEEETAERVWIWKVADDGENLVTTTGSGHELVAPLRPFFGTIGVAPDHGEVRTSVHLGAFGGNIDSPLLSAGATIFLEARRQGGEITIGDGHLAQGDGEFAGTAVEGQLRAELHFDVLRADETTGPVVPRLVTADSIVTIGWGRPLDDAFRTALHAMVRWVAGTTGMDDLDAYQLVSQRCEARVANVVNPENSVSVRLDRDALGGATDVWTRSHDRLALQNRRTS